jgi:SAM-dependent methyltransferase
MKIFDLPSCPACGAQEFAWFELRPGHPLRRCLACETVSAGRYADPSEVYVDGYMFGEVGAFGLDVRAPAFQHYLLRVANERLDMIESARDGRPGSLLDVGSGTGEVLVTARDRGWQVHGVEPERTAAEMAQSRGVEVTISHLEDAGLPERSFDVVSAFHVLEHQPDSRGFLSALSRWVRPGGHLVIEVPNWRSVQRRRLRGDWPGLRPLEHLVHFTPTTLADTFRRVGLDPVLVRSPVYVGAPQGFDDALNDLVRHGRYRKMIEPFTREEGSNGSIRRVPTRTGWKLLRGTGAVYDRLGVGAVVLCAGRVP